MDKKTETEQAIMGILDDFSSVIPGDLAMRFEMAVRDLVDTRDREWRAFCTLVRDEVHFAMEDLDVGPEL